MTKRLVDIDNMTEEVLEGLYKKLEEGKERIKNIKC